MIITDRQNERLIKQLETTRNNLKDIKSNIISGIQERVVQDSIIRIDLVIKCLDKDKEALKQLKKVTK